MTAVLVARRPLPGLATLIGVVSFFPAVIAFSFLGRGFPLSGFIIAPSGLLLQGIKFHWLWAVMVLTTARSSGVGAMATFVATTTPSLFQVALLDNVVELDSHINQTGQTVGLSFLLQELVFDFPLEPIEELRTIRLVVPAKVSLKSLELDCVVPC